MNSLDIFLAIIILFGSYLGYRKGIVIEICTLAALLLGAWAGIKFSGVVADFINGFFDEPSQWVPLISFAICFIAVVALVFFIGKWLERFVKITMLKPIDRILGALFGLVKFIVICGVLLNMLSLHEPSSGLITEEQKKSSLLYEPLTSLVSEYIPLTEIKAVQEINDKVL
ncbi:MAG: CvpA family protein [Bacteroidota bacterium]